jgi:hypothetical protein
VRGPKEAHEKNPGGAQNNGNQGWRIEKTTHNINKYNGLRRFAKGNQKVIQGNPITFLKS